MSSAVFPSRGPCTQVIDNIQRCQCPSFASPLLDPYICVNCGHGIHAHADYVSMVVYHHPPTQCAAPAAVSLSIDAINDPYAPSSTSFSRNANFVPITAAPVFSPSPRAFVPSSEVGNISLAPTPISSPSASSASSGIKSDITQAQAYGPGDHFVHYPGPDHFMNDSYNRQPDGGATDENLYYHDHSNVYDPTSEAWSGPYA
ncbi:hypothetical protein ARMGADRAFT_1092225 [Armillaria gallica]|uniref:Uncharacterized protein n=1 Tax=Armillaria gallica TaxID=47427 RepID=A0A2H3CGH4_ARMGA|nr:hypothetical protein ARMGADRAFT_1092225 [Armillaria gallica]